MKSSELCDGTVSFIFEVQTSQYYQGYMSASPPSVSPSGPCRAIAIVVIVIVEVMLVSSS